MYIYRCSCIYVFVYIDSGFTSVHKYWYWDVRSGAKPYVFGHECIFIAVQRSCDLQHVGQLLESVRCRTELCPWGTLHSTMSTRFRSKWILRRTWHRSHAIPMSSRSTKHLHWLSEAPTTVVVSLYIVSHTKLIESKHLQCSPIILFVRSCDKRVLSVVSVLSHIMITDGQCTFLGWLHAFCAVRHLAALLIIFTWSVVRAMSCFNGSLYLSATQWRFRYFPHMCLHGSTNISSCVVLVFTYVHW